MVAVARERVADRAALVLRDQRNAFPHHPLDLAALELRRILGIRQRRQLRLEPLDEGHEQIDVLEFRAANVHEPEPE